MKFGLTDLQLNQIIHVLSQFSEIEKAIIFGSRALGNFKPGSDIDICLFGKQLNDQIVTKIFGLLNDEVPLPFKFDVLLYHDSLDKELRNHILQHGKLLEA